MAEPVPCVVCGARFTPSTGRFWCSVACEAEAVRGDSPERDRLRDHLLARVREVYGDPELHTDHVGLQRAPGMDRWRVVSGRRGVVGVAPTEIEALHDALGKRSRGPETAGQAWAAIIAEARACPVIPTGLMADVWDDFNAAMDEIDPVTR